MDTQDLVFSDRLITALSTKISFCLLAPVLYYIWFVYRRRLDHVGLLGGISAYFLFGMLVRGFLLGLIQGEAAQAALGPWLYPLLRGLISAAAEVGGFWLGLRFLRRVRPSEANSARIPIGFGLGYRLYHLLILATSEALVMLMFAVNVNQDGLQAILENVDPASAPELEEQLRLLAASSHGEIWLSTLGYLCLFALSVCTARLVWYSMEGGLLPADRRLLLLAFAARLAGEGLQALYETGKGSFAACVVPYYVLTAALICFTWYQSGRRDSRELLHDTHLKSRMRPKR